MFLRKEMIGILLIALVLVVSGCSEEKTGKSKDTGTKTTEQTGADQSADTSKASDEEKDSTDASSDSSSSDQSSTTADSADDNKAPSAEESFYGEWKITKVQAYGPVGTYGKEDIKAIIGKKMTFSKESASDFGDTLDELNTTLENPVYSKTEIPKSKFETDNKITFSKLGIEGDAITEVDATDSNDNMCVFFLTGNEDKLLLYGGGTYFEMERVQP